MVIENLAELGGKALAMEQIRHAQRTPRNLVLVGRPDAPPGGADRVRALGLLPRAVERDVRRQDERTRRTDLQAFEHRHALPDQRRRFLEQSLQRQDHAIADQALHVSVQDSRGDQRQNGLLAADHQGMSGVVAALEAHHGLHLVGQQVDDLALALVAPLQTDYDEILTHYAPSRAMPDRPPC